MNAIRETKTMIQSDDFRIMNASYNSLISTEIGRKIYLKNYHSSNTPKLMSEAVQIFGNWNK